MTVKPELFTNVFKNRERAHPFLTTFQFTAVTSQIHSLTHSNQTAVINRRGGERVSPPWRKLFKLSLWRWLLPPPRRSAPLTAWKNLTWYELHSFDFSVTKNCFWPHFDLGVWNPRHWLKKRFRITRYLREW